MKEESEKMGLYLNIKKTKVMATMSLENISINIQPIEIVKNFTFLGSRIDKSADCSKEIRQRLLLGRTAMTKLLKIWNDKDITTRTKKKLVQSLIFPIALYGCESWTVKQEDRRRIEAFELWCWRKMLRVPWTAKMTNQEVLEKINCHHRLVMSLEAIALKHKLKYFGHVMRSNGLEKNLMIAMVEVPKKKKRTTKNKVDGRR